METDLIELQSLWVQNQDWEGIYNNNLASWGSEQEFYLQLILLEIFPASNGVCFDDAFKNSRCQTL